MTAPAILRPSAADQWANCPGWLAMRKFEKPEGQPEKEGTLIHLAGAFLLQGKAPEGPEFDAANDTGLLLTSELLEFAEGYAEAAREFAADAPFAVERAVTLAGMGAPKIGGTADLIAWWDIGQGVQELTVLDLKTGFAPVSPVQNYQLLCYWGGAVAEAGLLDSPPKCRLAIYQPRDYVSGQRLKIWEIPGKTALGWVELIIERGQAALTGGPCKTGEHCRYCDARVYCGAFLDSALVDFESTSWAPNDIDWTPESLGAMLEHLEKAATMTKAAFEALGDYAREEITQGRPVRGWEVSPSAGRRYWAASIEQIKGVEMATGHKLLEEKPIGITAARKFKSPIIESLFGIGSGDAKLRKTNPEKVKELFK